MGQDQPQKPKGFPHPIPNKNEEKTDPAIVLPKSQAPARIIAKMPDMGLLDPFMKDPEITEIMVNDLRNVMVEKKGQLSYSGVAFQSVDDLNRLTRSILDVTGRILSPDQPYVDTMLPDGSRINIVAPPPLRFMDPASRFENFQLKGLPSISSSNQEH